MNFSSASIYEHLIDEEDARACDDIPEAACRETPRNFLLILAAQFCTKLGDALASPKIVLAWVMSAVQAPVALTGLLVPIRESGSLVPQIVIAGWIRRFAVRKWFWVAGSLVQAACVALMGLAALAFDGAAAGLAILGLLIVFSLARGVCSVSSKDVVGKTVPKRRRGRLTGWAASVAGSVTVGVGIVLLVTGDATEGGAFFAPLLLVAGGLWLAGAGLFARIREYPGETTGGAEAAAGAWQRLHLLVSDAPFRRFVLTRSLLLCSALSAPYYVLLARAQPGAGGSLLGLFVLAAGIANLVSGPVWGRFADRSSKQVLAAAALISGGIGIVVFTALALTPSLAARPAFFPVAYFILSVAHDGVRVGRKTYVIDLARGNKRTDYVSVSNTAIGIVLLVAGLSGALSSVLSLAGIVLLLSLFGLGGAWLASTLEEVE